MTNDVNRLNELLNRACSLIDSLESLHLLIDEKGYLESELCKDVQSLYDDVNALEEDAPKYDGAGFTVEDRKVDNQ